MKHASSLLLATAAAGLAAAESTTIVKVLVPMIDSQSIDASVVSAGPTATAYRLTCPPNRDAVDCGLADGISILYGPSTMTYAASLSTSYSDVPDTTTYV